MTKDLTATITSKEGITTRSLSDTWYNPIICNSGEIYLNAVRRYLKEFCETPKTERELLRNTPVLIELAHYLSLFQSETKLQVLFGNSYLALREFRQQLS